MRCRVCNNHRLEADLLPPQPRYKTRICRACKSDQQRKTDQSPRGKEARRNSQLKRRYGISHTDYTQMLAEQGGACAICKKSSTACFNGLLHVDHDHATGAVRGLLCPLCNTVLGKMNDSPELLRVAAEYLER